MTMFYESMPCRYVIMLMIFGCSAVLNMQKHCISVNIVAMVPSYNESNSNSLNWNAYQRANVLTIVYWGDMVACLVAGSIVMRWGSRQIVFISVLGMTIFTLLSPPAAKFSYIAMLIVRLLLGFCEGLIVPALQSLTSRWAIPTEKGKFQGCLMLGTLGMSISWAISGWTVEALGWEWGFYIFGIIGVLYCVLWLYMGYDSPDTHPRISMMEKSFIFNHLGKDDANKNTPIPLWKILSSVPFWSLAILHFGSGCGAYFVISIGPSYISKALGFGLSSSGMLSAIIYLVKATASVISGTAGDVLLKRGLSLNVLRRVSTIISHILPGCALFLMVIPNMASSFYIYMLIISMMFNGAISLTVFANAHDLTKNFIGTVSAFGMMFMYLAAVLSPSVAAFFTKEEENNVALWKPVFYLGGTVFILSGLQFIVVGSTKRQPWDEVEIDDKTME